MKKKKSGFIKWIVIVVILLAVVSAIFGSKEDSKETSSKTDQKENPENASANEGTQLDDFAYTVDGDNIELADYSGNSAVLTINDKYTVDGVEYIVDDLLNFHVGSSSVKTLIISEGITELNNTIFNGAAITTLYLPKSLTSIEDDTLAYLNEDDINLHYGGSEEEWNAILVAHEEKSVSEEWENGNHEEAGAALADKLNSWVGHKYDASKFTFHYESNPSNIEIE